MSTNDPALAPPDESGPIPAGPHDDRPTTPDPLARYTARMRRQRRWYLAVVAVIVLVIAIATKVVLAHGEAAHAHLRTATSSVPAPSSAAPAPSLVLGWKNSDATAGGQPISGGTIVTYSAHTVSGRNYATGATAWSYTRTDATICDVLQEQGKTIAFFDHAGNCDEVSSFNTDTGTRAWYRTFFENGLAVNGKPSYAINQYTVLMTTPQLVWAIDPSGGLDRWTFTPPPGCAVSGSALGGDGVLISEHCADGNHLLLRDPYAANQTPDGKNNPAANPKWRVAADVTPVSADDLIAGLDRQTGALVKYDAANGKTIATVPLTPTPAAGAAVSATSGSGIELISIGTHSYGIAPGTGAVLWSSAALGPATLSGGLALVATRAGVQPIAARSGIHAPVNSLATEPAAGTAPFPLGDGYLLAGPSTSYYRS